MKKQVVIELSANDIELLQEKLDDGWNVIHAIPVQSGMSCHTYTRYIIYILEKGENQ